MTPLFAALTEDQELFRETTARFLLDRVPPGELRRLSDEPAGFSDDYWRAGCELGWTSLLVAETVGGGSISGSPVSDLCLVAYEFGRHAAPGPLLGANLVAASLGTGGHDELLQQVLTGGAVPAWCGDGDCHLRRGYGGLVLDGHFPTVEAAGQATHLLVTAEEKDGFSQALVPVDAPGVTLKELSSLDLTRRFARVDLRGTPVPANAVVGGAGRAGPAVQRQRLLALAVSGAESVGAMQRAFEMTVEWATDRYSFGRPLASYQALKHRFADMRTWLEASHAIVGAAARSLDAGSPDADELTAVAAAYVGQYGSELLQDCVQMHGGIGVTFEHDLHLLLRRHTLNRTRFGTPAEHRQRIGRMVLASGRAS